MLTPIEYSKNFRLTAILIAAHKFNAKRNSILKCRLFLVSWPGKDLNTDKDCMRLDITPQRSLVVNQDWSNYDFFMKKVYETLH
jgi:hypothetical protein